MTPSERFFAFARDPQIAAVAFADQPAWLWSADGRLLWCNAAGAAVLGADTPAALIEGPRDRSSAAGREIAALFARLPIGGGPQLARLRAFATSPLAPPPTCACRRHRGPDGIAVLVVAAGPYRPALSFAERVRRMVTDCPDLAAFAPDGGLIHAGDAAVAWAPAEGGPETWRGAPTVAEALTSGHAVAEAAGGTVMLERFGSGDATALIARFEPALAPVTQESPSDTAEAKPVEPETLTEPDMAKPEPSPVDVSGVDASPPAAPETDAASPGAELAVLDAMTGRFVERRHPLRFVWSMDADGAFMIEEGEFTALAGEPTAALLGRPWAEVAAALGLDPAQEVAKAAAARGTWSGIVVEWPAGGAPEALPVALSGVPVFGSDRSFHGYRGFGVCRDVGRIAAAIAARRALLQGPAAEPAAAPEAPSAPVDPEVDTRPADVFALPMARGFHTGFAAAPNVVPLRADMVSDGLVPDSRPTLSPVERTAFSEIARALGARIETEDIALPPDADEQIVVPFGGGIQPFRAQPDEAPVPGSAIAESGGERDAPEKPPGVIEHAILDRLPQAVAVFRGDTFLFANRALLDWTGRDSLEALAAAGGPDALFADAGAAQAASAEGPARTLSLKHADGSALPVEASLFALPMEGGAAVMLLLSRAEAPQQKPRDRDDRVRGADASENELRTILDTATDGVILVSQDGKILSANRGAEALFERGQSDLARRSFLDLFAYESRRIVAGYIDSLSHDAAATPLNRGREVTGRARQGGLIPLFMTMARLADDPPRFCAVFRDMSHWKRVEDELNEAKRRAEQTSTAKSEFLAKISHEIRTPLNAIIGFSEVMMEERLGPIGNERYHGYARDVHASGTHIVSLLNDLLDLSKIEAGKLDLAFGRVDLNEAMQQCVAIMQPQASRERIIVRTALAASLPPVVADARSVRQILLNLLSNSIKFTGAGGQVIVSTAVTDAGEALLRVRDTGIGMSDGDIATALEPFRRLPASGRAKADGTGLGLPLTKALAEANRAEFRIKSAVNAGTLVEIVFPAARLAAE